MKNLHDAETLNELTMRINKLQPGSQRQWGKMNVAQMMAHLSTAIEANLGDVVHKQNFMGEIFGKIAKNSIVGPKPIKHGLPTDPHFVILDDKDFNTEKQRLLAVIKRLSASDPEAQAKNTHPFFGKMTGTEWNALNYKHLDHHLMQFGA